MDEKPNKYEQLPIPTYEEATSSRPASSLSRVGPEEISDDAERQGLLGQSSGSTTRRGNYEPPTVESERSSLDSLDGLDNDNDTNEVRREMQEMDMEDPNNDNGSHRSLLTYRFKRFASFTSSFPSFSFPSFKRFVPSIKWPKLNLESMDGDRVVILGRLVGVFILIGFLYLLIASGILTMGRDRLGPGKLLPPEEIKGFIQASFNERVHIKSHLEYITRYPHMAGSEGSYMLGEWIAEMFKMHGLEEVGFDKYEVYINYPKEGGRRLTLGDWEASIRENDEKTPVFHGHSRAGEVSGPLIFANYGSEQDFADLGSQGVEVKDSIVLVRQSGTQGDAALKIKAAQDAGAAGCIIFSDPDQDRPAQGSEFVVGVGMPEDGIRRGSVSMMSRLVGDVLSPGYAALPKNKQRLSPAESAGLVSIPSLPISWADASHLLAQLQGHGEKSNVEHFGDPNTVYWTGNQSSPVVNLKNDQDEEIYQPIYNVIGSIKGWEQPQKRIVVGNHRDSWCLGAASPGSGTAIMIMMIRIFKKLQDIGWRPLRTVEFVSWDAGEFNAAGSTEYVEEYIDELRRHGVAYVNVDAGVTGVDFEVSGSPVFEGSLRHILNRVSDPISNRTVRDVWTDRKEKLHPLAAGGDYVPFQFMAGTSSIDLKFKGADYPRDSCYDNFDWVKDFGDSTDDYAYHAALGQIWALLILDLCDAPLLPFDMKAYVVALQNYKQDLETLFATTGPSGRDDSPQPSFDLDPINKSLDFLAEQVTRLQAWDQSWYNSVYSSGGFETTTMTVKRIDRNNRVVNFEARLLDLPQPDAAGATGEAVGNAGGLPERSQYKHIVTAPDWNDGTKVEIFPAIRYWFHKSDWTKVNDEIIKVGDIIYNAAMELTV